MRRIGRQIKDEQSSPLPRSGSLPHLFAVMNPRIVQNDNRYLSDRKAKPLELLNDKLAANCLFARRRPTLIASAHQRETIDTFAFTARHRGFFIPKLPAIWHVRL